jgi:hypothetical protein
MRLTTPKTLKPRHYANEKPKSQSTRQLRRENESVGHCPKKWHNSARVPLGTHIR